MSEPKGAKYGRLELGGYPIEGTRFETKEQHALWKETWIARRGYGFVRKKNSGTVSWWVCSRCKKGGFKCVRGRVPLVVDGKRMRGKYAYTWFTYDDVRPCNCGVNWGIPAVGQVFNERALLTAACRRMFGGCNYTITEDTYVIAFGCKFCDGRVEGHLTRTVLSNNRRGFGAPVTVTQVRECSESCTRPVSSLIRDADEKCLVCYGDLSLEPPSATAVRLVGCCNSVMCLTCLEELVKKRPHHLEQNAHYETYVIAFDPSPGNVGNHYYRCPFTNVFDCGSKCQKWYTTHEVEHYVGDGAGCGSWEKTTLQEVVKIPNGFVYDVTTELDRPEYDAAVVADQLQQYRAHLDRTRTMPVLAATEWHPNDGGSPDRPVNLELD